MKLPISVVMTSSVPDRTLRTPGQSAHAAPPQMPARKVSGITSAAGAPFMPSTTKVAAIAPT